MNIVNAYTKSRKSKLTCSDMQCLHADSGEGRIWGQWFP